MKTTSILIILLLLLPITAFSISMSEGSIDNKSETPIAVMMKIVKVVELKKLDKDWNAAKVGQPLVTGDELKTGQKSLALVKFTDNSLIRVRENSFLKIFADKNNKALSKNTYIEKGKVGFQVAKQENEEFKFTTPTMVASIRGTEGIFEVLPNGSSLLVVIEGLVEVVGTLGEKKQGSVGGGQYALFNEDGDLTLGDATDEMKSNAQTVNRNTTLKKLRIQTNQGELIIEYYAE